MLAVFRLARSRFAYRISGTVSPVMEEPANSPNTTTKPTNEFQEVKKELGSYERATLWWTIMIVCINALTCVFIGLQWHEMKSGSSDTHTLAEAAKKQADKMTNVSDAADKIKEAAQNMVVQDQRIADNAQKAIEASNRQSAAALKASIDASKLDQRAWVGMAPLQLVDSVLNEKQLDFTFAYTNTGKSPAIDVIPCSKAAIIPTQSWREAYDRAFKPLPIDDCISPVGPSPLMPSGIGVIRLTVPNTPGDSVLIAKKQALVYVYGSIKYNDVFGKPHEITFCTLMGTNLPDPDEPKIHGNCVNGNTILY
jgi:hypothetical protein